MRTLQTVIDNLESNSKGTAVLSMSREGLVHQTAGDFSDSVRRLAGGLIRSGLSAGEPVIHQAEPSANRLA
jgi:hypothetical protein